MAGWLDRLRGERSRDGQLPALLASYPPYCIPFPGRGWALTLVQAEANMDYLLAHKAERLRIVGQLLAQFGIDLGAGLAAPDPKPFLDAIWRWTAAEWPLVYDPALASLDAWLSSRRDGPEIVFSLIADTGIALGEIVLMHRPDYAWALDLDPDNKAETRDDTMASWQRPVLLRPADTIVPVMMLDVEDAVYVTYARCTRPSYLVINDLGRVVLDAVSGANERYWRDQAAREPPDAEM